MVDGIKQTYTHEYIYNCYLYCCCVSIIIVICICPPGALIWLINLFYSILFYTYTNMNIQINHTLKQT